MPNTRTAAISGNAPISKGITATEHTATAASRSAKPS
jgi:hypothetical protein